MVESQDESLVAACARVREHPHPAYVKSSELRYLAVSTMDYPEICEYPDSGKFLATTGMQPGAFRSLGRAADGLDYWDGEA